MVDVERHFARGLVECEAQAEFGSIVCRPWASVTFQGQVVIAVLSLPCAAADRLGGRIGEHEFAIPGHIVADAAIVARDDGPGGSTVTVEALIIEAA